MKDYKKIAEHVQENGWEGVTHKSARQELVRVYKLLDFFQDSLNDYLNQNERTVLNRIDTDKPPREVAEELIEIEQEDKNRPKVVKKLKKFC